jgi:hypothetical protein
MRKLESAFSAEHSPTTVRAGKAIIASALVYANTRPGFFDRCQHGSNDQMPGKGAVSEEPGQVSRLNSKVFRCRGLTEGKLGMNVTPSTEHNYCVLMHGAKFDFLKLGKRGIHDTDFRYSSPHSILGFLQHDQ